MDNYNRNGRPDLREQVGVAVNASALTLRTARETPLLHIAAVGAAAAAIRCGADQQNLPIASMQPAAIARGIGMRTLMLHPPKPGPDPRDVIASDLAPMLWHIRYGGQHAHVPQAVDLFAQWMMHRRSFADSRTPDQVRVLLAFSARVMHEWLSDKCAACGGTGKLERTREGNMVKPRGSMQRNAVFRPCAGCGGNGHARPRAAERTRQLGISMKLYESQRWSQRFSMALNWLSSILAQRLHSPLTHELERRTRRR